jgi:nicotinamide mononucleotide (NMN) deamidase PncC
VGTVYFGLASAAGTRDLRVVFRGNRWQVQEAATHQALDLLRLTLDENHA